VTLLMNVLHELSGLFFDDGWLAPAILGVVLGQMMEENFIKSMIKSDGDITAFVTRPIAGFLAVSTFIILLWPVGAWLWRRYRAS